MNFSINISSSVQVACFIFSDFVQCTSYNNNLTLAQRRQDSGKISGRASSPKVRRLSNGNVRAPVPEYSRNSSRESRKARDNEPCRHMSDPRKCLDDMYGKVHGDGPRIQARRGQRGVGSRSTRPAGEPRHHTSSPLHDIVCLRSIPNVGGTSG